MEDVGIDKINFTSVKQQYLSTSTTDMITIAQQEVQTEDRQVLIRYAEFDEVTKFAVFGSLELDQQIYEALNNEIYNNGIYKKDWANAYFDVQLIESDRVPETVTKIKGKQQASY